MPQAKIEAVKMAAKAVLDARCGGGGASLAQLYDPLLMPLELRHAHQQLDRVVLRLYNLSANSTAAQRLEVLLQRYQQLLAPLLPEEQPNKRARRRRIPR